MPNSRRKFLGGLGLLGGAALSAVASAAESPAGHWDRDVDVICVGGGAAGCTAAVTATHQVG